MIRALAIAILLTACGTSDPGSSSDDTGDDQGGDDGTDAGSNDTSATGPTQVMPLISRGVPAFASTGTNASASNDDSPASSWGADSVPAWLAYDLSSVPSEQRQRVLVSVYALHAPCYIDTADAPSGGRPVDYVLEANAAAGGASPPSDGWTALATVQDSHYCNRDHLVQLDGANWLRLRATKGDKDHTVSFDLDVHSAPAGASDAWLFMGDSITYMTMTYAFSDLPALVHTAHPAAYPAVIDAAIGGTNTGTALDAIDDTLRDFPGRYVVLAYGTNDHADSFPGQMETLVEKVIAAGKTPVIPHMPWSSGSTEGEAINASIDGLYAQHPEIVHGPDLWTFFTNRTDYIPAGDVHPNGVGQEALRGEWARVMAGLYP